MHLKVLERIMDVDSRTPRMTPFPLQNQVWPARFQECFQWFPNPWKKTVFHPDPGLGGIIYTMQVTTELSKREFPLQMLRTWGGPSAMDPWIPKVTRSSPSFSWHLHVGSVHPSHEEQEKGLTTIRQTSQADSIEGSSSDAPQPLTKAEGGGQGGGRRNCPTSSILQTFFCLTFFYLDPPRGVSW